MAGYCVMILLAVAIFETAIFARLIDDARVIVSISVSSTRAMLSSEMGDPEKEALMRRVAVSVFRATIRFLLKLTLIFLVLYGLFVAMVVWFESLAQFILERVSSPLSIIVITFSIVCYALLRKAILVGPVNKLARMAALDVHTDMKDP